MTPDDDYLVSYAHDQQRAAVMRQIRGDECAHCWHPWHGVGCVTKGCTCPTSFEEAS